MLLSRTRSSLAVVAVVTLALALLAPRPASAAGVNVQLLFGDDTPVTDGYVVAAGPGAQAVVSDGGTPHSLDLPNGTWDLVGMAEATGTRSAGVTRVTVANGVATPSSLTLYVTDRDAPGPGLPGRNFVNCVPVDPEPGDTVECVAGTFDPGTTATIRVSGVGTFTETVGDAGQVRFSYVHPGGDGGAGGGGGVGGGGGGGGGGLVEVTGTEGGEDNVVTSLDASEVCDAVDPVSFDDVASDGIFAPDITCIAGYGVVDGTGDGRFVPADPVTRGQASKFVANQVEVSVGTPLTTPAASGFDDVPAGGTFTDVIGQLARAGIVAGTSSTTFEPARSLTRGEMASIVHDALEEVGVDLAAVAPDFPDVDTAGVFGSRIGALAAAGVLEGFADGTFRPGDDITRGQLSRYVTLSMAVADGQDPDLFAGNGTRADLVEASSSTSSARIGTSALRSSSTVERLDLPFTAFEVRSVGLRSDDAVLRAGLTTTSGAAQLYVVLPDGSARRAIGMPATASVDLVDPTASRAVRLLVLADAVDTDVTLDWTVEPETIPFHARVNAGGQEVAATDGGPAWERDSRASQSQYLTQGSNTTYDGPVTTLVGVPGYVPLDLFATERWGSRTSPNGTLEPFLRYEFPIQAGQEVTLNLFVGDGFDPTDGAGLRVFDVAVDGALWLDDVDLSVAPGWGTGTMRTFTLVSDGRVDLVFRNDVENPSVRAIEVVSTGFPG